MDETDLRILRELVWSPHDPADGRPPVVGAWDIAKRLRVHGNTVKRRLEHMESLGVLRGMHMWPELGNLGQDNALYRFVFADNDARRRGTEVAETDPAISDTLSFVGNEAWFGVTVQEGEDLEVAADRFAARVGARRLDLIEERRWESEAATSFERRVLAEYNQDALLSLSEVATRVGATHKTVRRALERMVEKKAFVIFPFLYPARMEGLIPFVLQVGPAADAPDLSVALRRAFPDHVQGCLPGARLPWVLLAARNTATIADAVAAAERLPGVATARHLLIESSTTCSTHEDALRVSEAVERPEMVLA